MIRRFFRFGLHTNVGALQLFHALRQGSILLISILLAQSALATDAIGTYEQLLFIGYALSFFWLDGLIQSMLTLYPKQADAERPAFRFQAYVLFAGLSLLLWSLLQIGEGRIVPFLTANDSLPYYDLFTAYLALNVPTYLLEHFFQLDQRPPRIVAFGLLSFVGQLVVVIAPVWLGWDFRWSFVGLLALGAVKHAWLLAYLFGHARPGWNRKVMQQWLVLAAPLIAYALLGGLAQTFDGWLVNYAFEGDQSRFAIWRYGARELPFSLAMVGAFNTAFLPILSEDRDAGLAQMKRQSRWLFHLLFPVTMILLLTSRWWFPWLFSGDFTASVPVFNLFLLIVISRLIFSRTILMALQANTAILFISGVELLINIGLSFALVGPMGLAGIALATVIAFTFEKIMLILLLYRRFGVGLSRYADVRLLLLYSLGVLGCYVVSLF